MKGWKVASVRSDDRAEQPPSRLSAGALFRAHSQFVAAFLARLGVPSADVDDLVQEVFLVVHRKGGFELGPAQPRSWLGAIAVRVASTRRRTQTRRREQFGDDLVDAVSVSVATHPDEQVGARQALTRVQHALDTMDVEHRGVFVLYELEGESCAAIAGAFGVPVGTVYSRLHTARRRFADAHARLAQVDTASESEAGTASEPAVAHAGAAPLTIGGGR